MRSEQTISELRAWRAIEAAERERDLAQLRLEAARREFVAAVRANRRAQLHAVGEERAPLAVGPSARS